ncbi:MAG TPA: hemerythrin domain-containing protein [Streptosporangiaceae bacterium]|nr:hemerythrin domain-containing protein [Streptosporangiaceae bacterium]
MADVFELLRAEHAEVEKMLAVLDENSEDAAGAGDDEWVAAARASVARWLVIESFRHEAVKEQFFWPAVRANLPDGDEIAGQARAHERQMVATLARLHEADPATSQFDQMIDAASSLVRYQIEFEETEIWPKLRAAMRPGQARRLAQELRNAGNLSPAPQVATLATHGGQRV